MLKVSQRSPLGYVQNELNTPRSIADHFLHSSVVGISSVPKFQGHISRNTDAHLEINWPSEDYLFRIRQSQHSQHEQRKDRAGTLFGLCIDAIIRNRRFFLPSEMQQLPFVLQDVLLMELLHHQENDSKLVTDECLDLFLSSETYRLNLPVVDAITDCTIRSIAQRCNNLADLSLCGFVHLSDDCLEQLSIYCAKLKYLDLSFCHRISDRGVSFIAKGCQSLKKLTLHQCRGVTYFGIVQIGKSCRHLTKLDLTGTQYCEDSLLYLIRHCEQLESLTLYGTPIPKKKLATFLFVNNSYFDVDGPDSLDWSDHSIENSIWPDDDTTSLPDNKRKATAFDKNSLFSKFGCCVAK